MAARQLLSSRFCTSWATPIQMIVNAIWIALTTHNTPHWLNSIYCQQRHKNTHTTYGTQLKTPTCIKILNKIFLKKLFFLGEKSFRKWSFSPSWSISFSVSYFTYKNTNKPLFKVHWWFDSLDGDISHFSQWFIIWCLFHKLSDSLWIWILSA